MWETFLQLNRTSSLFPRRWTLWQLRIEPNTRQTDWAAVATDYDAVHVTVDAVAAVQGSYFRADDDLVAPFYLDLDTTLWLRRRISAAELVRVQC